MNTLDPDISAILEEITEENIPDNLDDPHKPFWDAIDAITSTQ